MNCQQWMPLLMRKHQIHSAHISLEGAVLPAQEDLKAYLSDSSVKLYLLYIFKDRIPLIFH